MQYEQLFRIFIHKKSPQKTLDSNQKSALEEFLSLRPGYGLQDPNDEPSSGCPQIPFQYFI